MLSQYCKLVRGKRKHESVKTDSRGLHTMYGVCLGNNCIIQEGLFVIEVIFYKTGNICESNSARKAVIIIDKYKMMHKP
jgi:hypothetical protein